MYFEIRPLQEKDIDLCVDLDKKWFGEYGISKEDLQKSLHHSLGIFEQDGLQGFATFEMLDGSMPKAYVGEAKPDGKILFIQQFTTSTNYKKNNFSSDALLLSAVEQKAKNLRCLEIWEALAKDHPYSIENNSEFDAFGFYLSHGFVLDKNETLIWKPSAAISIPCYLFRHVFDKIKV